MFICVSPNPAIDKRLRVPHLAPGQINRACTVQAFPGGKSAHVAMVLRTLGESPVWTGLVGGSTGSELVAGLSALGIHTHPAEMTQPTRTNLEVVEDSGRVTEILEPGAAPSAEELDAFEKACEALFAQGREEAVVIFSGSLPAGVAPDFYARLIALSQQFGGSAFLDASGDPLRLALLAKPQFVKPNREEAAHLLGMPIESLSAASLAVRKLLSLGARSAALSLGAEGLLFCAAAAAPIVFAPALSLPVRSTVGCGDSALAGFARALALNASAEDAVRLAAACAAANCLADSPGAARLADIQRFQSQILVQTLPSDP
jgi:1-phosphofructokinase family hexose kinase